MTINLITLFERDLHKELKRRIHAGIYVSHIPEDAVLGTTGEVVGTNIIVNLYNFGQEATFKKTLFDAELGCGHWDELVKKFADDVYRDYLEHVLAIYFNEIPSEEVIEIACDEIRTTQELRTRYKRPEFLTEYLNVPVTKRG